MAFVEGEEAGIITWETLAQSLEMRMSVDAKKHVLAIDLMKDFHQNSRMCVYWWTEFLDNTLPAIFGVDDPTLNNIVTFFLGLHREHKEFIGMDACCANLNYMWREEYILANILLAMVKENQKRAVFVFGSAHKKTFEYLYKKRNIEISVLEP